MSWRMIRGRKERRGVVIFNAYLHTYMGWIISFSWACCDRAASRRLAMVAQNAEPLMEQWTGQTGRVFFI